MIARICALTKSGLCLCTRYTVNGNSTEIRFSVRSVRPVLCMLLYSYYTVSYKSCARVMTVWAPSEMRACLILKKMQMKQNKKKEQVSSGIPMKSTVHCRPNRHECVCMNLEFAHFIFARIWGMKRRERKTKTRHLSSVKRSFMKNIFSWFLNHCFSAKWFSFSQVRRKIFLSLETANGIEYIWTLERMRQNGSTLLLVYHHFVLQGVGTKRKWFAFQTSSFDFRLDLSDFNTISRQISIENVTMHFVCFCCKIVFNAVRIDNQINEHIEMGKKEWKKYFLSHSWWTKSNACVRTIELSNVFFEFLNRENFPFVFVKFQKCRDMHRAIRNRCYD